MTITKSKNRTPIIEPGIYTELLRAIKERIQTARYEALRAVNTRLVSLYWDIGRLIVDRQKGDSWGKAVVQQLSKDLQAEFQGVAGFSPQNLWYMRQFYLTYSTLPKLQPLVGEISWSHNLTILSKCKDDQEREFYLRMAHRHAWSKSTLIQQITSNAFLRAATGKTNFGITLPSNLISQATHAVKDEYIFDFLELGEEHNEYQLEAALVANVEPFLREMGGAFTFVGRQYPLRVSDREYFVDLLLYNRYMKALVAIELKAGPFLPEYVGKMQFYLALLDDLARVSGENPSVGIILCKSREETIVEYALRESRKPVGVAGYRRVSALPEELAGKLPDPNQVALLLDGLTTVP